MAEFDFTAFVKTLPKEELTDLVIRFAPESYREELKNRQLSEQEAKETFDWIVLGIKKVLEDDEFWDKPSEFDSQLSRMAERLSGLWDRFQEETGELFLFCIKKIGKIQDSGFLYQHWPEQFYYGFGFLEVIQKFAWSLPFNQKIEFVQKLENDIKSFGYETFYNYSRELNLIFKESDKVLLKNFIIKSVKLGESTYHKHYYHFLKDVFSLEEKAVVLEKIYHHDSSLCLDLVETLVSLKRSVTAIDYLEELKNFNSNPWIFTEMLFIQLVDLKKSEGLPFFEDVIFGIKKYRTHTFLEKAVQLCPEKKEELEEISKSASHYFFLKYLIDNNRIEESYQLVMESKSLDDQSMLDFFKNYCERFPGDATNYFIALIDKELPYSGSRHYEMIVDLLQYLFKVSPSKAVDIASMIKRDYKRRKNLIAMLDQRF